MKRLLLFVCAVIGMVACTQNPIEEQAAVRTDAPETIRVGFEDNETRIQLNEAQKTVWTKGDLVSVFYRSNANQKWQYQGETGERVGNLKRIANAEATQELSSVVVVYPYSDSYYINPKSCNVEAHLPAEQTYLKDSYGLNGNIMLSQSEFNQFSLKNVCGWLKIQLKGEGQVVKKITLRGNNNEQVAGLVYIDSADATITLANEQGDIDDVENGTGGNLVFDDTILTEVTLNCGESVTLSGATSTFHIGLPPQTFEKGLTLTVEYSDGSKMTKSTSNSIAIERNTIQPMSTLYYDGNLPPVFELAYTTNDGEPLDPYTTEGFGADFVENIYDAATGKGALKFDGRITTIPEKAFIACGNLSEITLTSDIKYIRAEAFNGCSVLAKMDIPNSVTSIGNKAFYNCSGMQEITIPNSVTSVGTSSFEGCGGKANINCKIASVYSNTTGKFYNTKFTEVIIGDSVTSIGGYAFYDCDSLTSVTICDSVTSIGNSAFSGCSNLTSVTIGNSVTSIGEDAFINTNNVREVYYTGDLAAWCKIDFSNYRAVPMNYSIDGGAKLYINGVELTEISIPSDITEIKYTFCGCTSLTSVTLHNRVTLIGDSTFYNCSSLSSITIGNRVASIGHDAFSGCSNLKEVYYTGNLSAWCKINFGDSGANPMCHGAKLYLNGVELTEIYIPSDITEIKYTFTGCTSLTSITLHDRVTEIGEYAFHGCSSLASVTIGNSVTSIGEDAFAYCSCLESITIPNSVTEIGEDAFLLCSSLTSATIGDSVTLIGYGAFERCRNLSSVTIGNSVTLIEDRAFWGCSSLTSVTIPDNVTSIGKYAFSNCNSLTSVTIGDGVIWVDTEAFYNCSSLSSLTIGNRVAAIGNSAFWGCRSLKEVYCKPTTPPSGAYNMFHYGTIFYVPTESVEAYKSASSWSNYAENIVGYDF